MSLFKKSSSSYLGIDLGTGSLKFVELANVEGKPRLVTYGMAEIETNISRDEAQESQEKIADTLKSLLKKANAQSKQVITALSNFSVFSSVISLPSLPEKEMAKAITWEAKKFVPMPIENVVLDWKIINDEENQQQEKPETKTSGKKMEKILLTAAPRKLVERYINIFKMAGLSLASLETESFALARSLVGNDNASILIADIGSLTTDLTVVENGVPVLSRSIDVGGKTVTKAVAGSMGIEEKRAEQFKRDVGISGSINKNQSNGVSNVIAQSFGSVINEMKYSLNLHKGQGQGRVEKVLLTGGSSFLPQITNYLTAQLGIKTFIANPWARVSYPKDLAETLEQLGPRMSVAIGLAMREIE